MKYIGQHIFDYVASFRQNVGVGTDTPGEKLTVAGNIEISVASTGAKGLIFNENGTQTMGILNNSKNIEFMLEDIIYADVT